ncbi:hypothetical protein AbraIFM66951_004702 [Aspergillus brasiliensis]|uniref:Uncharacterized protein n=1 Tax=Aspergillus brasiliensis TaxID=319629 RepID=A0A9W5YHW3_9EURO|nr:hypothetical protein AbraCBS73388_008325 [Aspergillus brasiliensis]GKZ43458.1 hypothetical protein AbraIFM66951_004702 [Aspergillus brasiliensis]
MPKVIKHENVKQTRQQSPAIEAFWAKVHSRRLQGGFHPNPGLMRHRRSKKPPKKNYTKEQKSEVVELYREAKSLGIPMCEFAKAISICRISLRSWVLIDNERASQERISVPEHSADTMTYLEDESDDKPYDEEGKYLYFLNLSTRQFRQVLLKESEYYKLHTFKHPVPFVGIETGRGRKIRTFEDAYAFLGGKVRTSDHTGHPQPPPAGDLPDDQLPFDAYSLAAYTDRSQPYMDGSFDIVEVNKALYELAPSFDQRAPRNRARRKPRPANPFYPEMEKCVALVCRSLYLSSDKGRYTDLRILIDNVYYQGAEVSLRTNVKHEPFQLLKMGDLSLTFSRNETFDRLFTLTKALTNNVESWIKLKHVSEDIDDWPDFTGGMNECDPSSSKGITSDDSVLEEVPQTGGVLDEQTNPSKLKYLKRQASLLKAIHKNFDMVDGVRKCGIPTCPLRHKPGSRFCIYHSEAISDLVLEFKFTDLVLPKWTLKLVPDAVGELKALKQQYENRPQHTWVIDTEFYNLKGGMSPIPFQIAIRQLDGKLLLSTNVDYDISLQDFSDQTTDWGTMKRSMPILFRRYYGGEKTNGMKPDQISTLIKQIGYRTDRTKILSWYSPLDMQCFLRLLSGDNKIVVPRLSHRGHSNFQEVNIGTLLKKLLPGSWPTTSLPLVHAAINATNGRDETKSEYHTAEYDTQAVIDVVREMIALLK